MTYKIKSDRIEDLKSGRTIKHIASKCDCSPNYISAVFSQKRNCSKAVAFLLASIGSNNKTDNLDIDEKVGFYFEKVVE